MSGEFAVIGLGQFGRALARSLTRDGQAVLAIDANPDRVQLMTPHVDAVVCADATDDAALDELGIERVACAIVAMGAKGREASILTATLLRSRGVPRIIARAVSPLHARVLLAVGAHEILNPEEEMGQRLAARLSHPSVVDQLSLGPDTSLAEVRTPAALSNKSLAQLDLRNRFDVSVVAVRRGSTVIPSPRATEVLLPEDVLVVVGDTSAVRKFASQV